MKKQTTDDTPKTQPPRRPPLRYRGSKWRLAPWIISHFPAHDCYCEPYGGGAGVLLRKPRAPFEIYNDLDSEVVNFFRVLRDRHQELLEALRLTPWSREEQRESFTVPADAGPVERARRLSLRAWMTHGGACTNWKSGWRFMRGKTREVGFRDLIANWRDVEYLVDVADRLLDIQIENDPALDVIRRFDQEHTLFYLDPPYVLTAFCDQRQRLYRHVMTEDDHRELAKVLHRIRGMAILSGYPSELYDELFAGWRHIERETSGTVHHSRTVEKLWFSPHITPSQMKLAI